MVKRGADTAALKVPATEPFESCCEEGQEDRPMSPDSCAAPAPGPQTPSASPSSEDGMPLAEDMVITSGVFATATVEQEASCLGTVTKKPKKMRLEMEQQPLVSEGSTSQVSTAAPTPTTSPCASPILAPTSTSPFGGVDYSKLSELELRELLGVVGTDIAAGWEKADIVAVLEELDKILPGMSTLQL